MGKRFHGSDTWFPCHGASSAESLHLLGTCPGARPIPSHPVPSRPTAGRTNSDHYCAGPGDPTHLPWLTKGVPTQIMPGPPGCPSPLAQASPEPGSQVKVLTGGGAVLGGRGGVCGGSLRAVVLHTPAGASSQPPGARSHTQAGCESNKPGAGAGAGRQAGAVSPVPPSVFMCLLTAV